MQGCCVLCKRCEIAKGTLEGLALSTFRILLYNIIDAYHHQVLCEMLLELFPFTSGHDCPVWAFQA